jgi:hypothetical protein
MAVHFFLGLSQLRVFRLGSDENRNVRVGVFPEREEILIGRLGFGGITLQDVGAGETEMRINLEREKERKERQAAYTASIQAKQKGADQRTAIKDSLYKLFGETLIST